MIAKLALFFYFCLFFFRRSASFHRKDTECSFFLITRGGVFSTSFSVAHDASETSHQQNHASKNGRNGGVYPHCTVLSAKYSSMAIDLKDWRLGMPSQ